MPALVEGRDCGSCNVCCVALTIRDPALEKPAGVRCRHNAADGRCGIYAERPDTCVGYHCGWRRLRWVKDALWPGRSRVLVHLMEHGGARGVGFMLLEERALDAEGLAESLAAAVAAGLRVFLVVPGPDGGSYGVSAVDEVLREPVRNRDKAELLRRLRLGWEQGRACAAEEGGTVLTTRPQ